MEPAAGPHNLDEHRPRPRRLRCQRNVRGDVAYPGYVEKAPDPTDGRARLVHIAERGAAATALANRAVAEVEAEWSAQLGQQRMRQLRHALTRLRELTDPYL
ncbi:MAG: hypothetical protein ACRDTE_23405 [Pseudonocardiaceae bacterium]